MADGDNYVTIVGRVGTAPELKRTTGAQVAVVEFRMAYQPRQQVNGEWQDAEPEWFSVKAWRKLAEKVSNLAVGTPIRVTGKLRVEAFTTREGEKRYHEKIVADSIAVEVNMTRDVEGGQGYATFGWGGRGGGSAPANNGIESALFDQTPF